MLLKSFYFNIFIRVSLLVITGIALGMVMLHLKSGYYYTLAGLAGLIMIQAVLLLKVVNKTNEDLEKFFSSIRDDDSSIRFSERTFNRTFMNLHKKLNEVNSIIQGVKIKNEINRQFLQNIVDHVNIGLLTLDRNGEIEIYNRAARNYLNINPGNHMGIEAASHELSKILHDIKPGQETLYKHKSSNHDKSILLKATEVKFDDRIIKIISFEDITRELDKKELESWQRLIRVLTHEIMNSVSPVTSLASVITGYYRNNADQTILKEGQVTDHIIQKTLEGLGTIQETGNGLMDFVDKYRSLASLPRPKSSGFKIESLFSKCKMLMESGLPENIHLTANVQPPDLELTADADQVERILINLIRNAADAIGTVDGEINMNAFQDDDQVHISVLDNGPGIDRDILEDIFIPFFTTRKNGSGIGLSISRQIMRNHNGTISAEPDREKGAKFTLTFPG